MPEKVNTTSETSKEKPYKFFLNGEPVDKIPQWALDKMSERLSRVVSEYFMQHPDEYERFLAAREKKRENDPVRI